MRDEIKDIINLKMHPIFERSGFKYIPSNNSFVKNGRNKEVFRIDIKKINNHYNLHLILMVYNEQIGVLREEVEEFLEQQELGPTISVRLKRKLKRNNALIAELTDWKSLDINNELHIWFESFSDIRNISDIDRQLDKAVELGLSWFKKCEDYDYLIQYNIERGMEYTINTALIILLFKNDLNQMESLFKKITCERKQKNLSIIKIVQFYNAICKYLNFKE